MTGSHGTSDRIPHSLTGLFTIEGRLLHTGFDDWDSRIPCGYIRRFSYKACRSTKAWTTRSYEMRYLQMQAAVAHRMAYAFSTTTVLSRGPSRMCNQIAVTVPKSTVI
ncbi:uncharacterized protein BO88DRAFT_132497 [Aspergillus vadensis CBS 113365]|uniref:Uncharacterized protein n=1 Tax=Aspergillus vadensis (strain CBS 113365 / IMI 142717 / IBT 24658) TaxID=1448311 RepID=A0A319CAB6_ASPVC|nr:hypothetical protein BO88DRAFT_132497 [Aspergillus vadensis CBS 113365]PYH65592.1 hypothetical protein BO88DRAFT_132497 [Aspergillus vadensis CBS 113365]